MKIFEDNGFVRFGKQNVWIKYYTKDNQTYPKYLATARLGNPNVFGVYNILIKNQNDDIILDTSDIEKIEDFFQQEKINTREDKINDILSK